MQLSLVTNEQLSIECKSIQAEYDRDYVGTCEGLDEESCTSDGHGRVGREGGREYKFQECPGPQLGTILQNFFANYLIVTCIIARLLSMIYLGVH